MHRCWCRCDVGVIFFGELESSSEECLSDCLASFEGNEDEVGVVGRDEEDWDACHG